MRRAKPKRVLEVGTLIGYLAILIGKELDDDAQIITVEMHVDKSKTAEENIGKASIPAKIKVLTGDAVQVIPKLKEYFDFLDAAKNEYLDYLRIAEDKLNKGTVKVADNAGIFANKMKKYLDYVRTSGKYRSKYAQVGVDGIEISVKT